MRPRAALLVALILAAACGGPPTSAARSAPPGGPSPSTSANANEILFAALEPGGDLTTMRDTAVAIVRMTGTARAKARFDARTLPKIGPADVLTQPEARVAAGKVYFADGAGVLRSLSVDGTIAPVTTFPTTTGQTLLSFAVSPDAGQVIGAEFNFPPLHNPPPQAPMDPPFGPGDYTFQLLSARPGQGPNVLSKQNWAQSAGPPRSALALVGWSREAPLATIDTQLGTQQTSQGRHMFGHVAELDTAGRPGPPIGGYSCLPWSVLPDETVLCDDDGQLRSFSVRTKDGNVRYRIHAEGEAEFLDVSLAPDGSHVAYLVNGGRAMVADSSGTATALPAAFEPQGWIGPGIVIGDIQTAQGPGNMAYVRLDKPTKVTDLGFKGFFAGVVQGA
jgi:hypothetical protein